MAAISGLLTLANVNTTNEWVSEFQETILVRNAKGINSGGATLFGLMSRLKTEPAETTEYNWFERDPVTRTFYLNAADEAGTGAHTTTLRFASTDAGTEDVSALIPVGSTLLNTISREMVYVSASGATSYTVTRGFGQTAAADAATSDPWILVSIGKAEGADPTLTAYEGASTLTNYIQTFNSSFKLANAFKGSRLRTDIEGPLRERRVQALERIARDIELAFFFGEKVRLGSTAYTYFTGGIKSAVDAASAVAGEVSGNVGTTGNILNGAAGTGVTIATFNTWLGNILTYGSENKLFFCGPSTYAALSNFANSASNGYRITGSEHILGMNITTIQTPFGLLDMAMHPLFKELTPFNDWGFIIDLALIVQKTMEPLFLEPYIQTPGQDSYQEQFRAKLGLKLKFASAFGYCYDLSYLKLS